MTQDLGRTGSGIAAKIFVLRGQQVKRHRDRFPIDFMFRLTNDEKKEVVTKRERLTRLKFSPVLPFAASNANTLASSKWSSTRSVL
jgi:hypothetical protein